jgi:hypothetical protein
MIVLRKIILLKIVLREIVLSLVAKPMSASKNSLCGHHPQTAPFPEQHKIV